MTIEERLTKLERRNRYLALTLGVLMVCSVLLGFTAQAKDEVPELLRAKKFELVDDVGQVRAALMANEDVAGLLLLDEKGARRAMLTALRGATFLNLLDGQGKDRASLGLTEDGSAFSLRDENDRLRAKLLIGKDGPDLALFDKNGTLRALLGVSATETPDGKTTNYPESSLLLFGPDGNMIWNAP